MKLVVFAHTPPPHHGQSLMVQLMVEGFRARTPRAGSGRAEAPTGSTGSTGSAGATLDPDRGGAPAGAAAASSAIVCYHVNARLSDDLADVGTGRAGKLLPLLKYCWAAVRARWRHGATTLYYIPAPPKRAPLVRDWIVMLLCRPWFRRIVFHWHAVGLGEWLDTQARPWERRLGHGLLDRADLALVLSRFNEADARRFRPRRCLVVANGIPDPCPDFDRSLRPHRLARAAARRAWFAEPDPASPAGPPVVRVLFLAHCTRDKGLFDALEGVRQANAGLRDRGLAVRFALTVAGSFLTAAEQAEFEVEAAAPGAGGWLRYVGFASGEAKAALWREADVFCAPTYFANEGQPVTLLEAMAYGLPLVTTRWRAIPEFVPPDYLGLIEPRAPGRVAEALCAVAAGESGEGFRALYLREFSLARHLERLAAALTSVDGAGEDEPGRGPAG